MEQTIEHCTVACLRLQQVLPLCEKAIEKFKTDVDISDNLSVKTIENQTSHAYAWIDSPLFVKTIASLLCDVLHCNESSCTDITIAVSLIGNCTCRILISDCAKPSLSGCEGPIDPAEYSLINFDLKYLISTITLHGGYFQVWKNPDTGSCLFEINLICMNDRERGDYDYLEA